MPNIYNKLIKYSVCVILASAAHTNSDPKRERKNN